MTGLGLKSRKVTITRGGGDKVIDATSNSP